MSPYGKASKLNSSRYRSMAGEFQTREFRISDYSVALELWKRVEGIEIAEGDDQQDVARFLEQNPGLSLVAESDNGVVGVALCGEDGRRGYIYHLAVEPAYHKRGVASQLVKECVEALRKRGLKRALILVAADNPGAYAFWQRSGWEDVPGAMVMGIDL